MRENPIRNCLPFRHGINESYSPAYELLDFGLVAFKMLINTLAIKFVSLLVSLYNKVRGVHYV